MSKLIRCIKDFPVAFNAYILKDTLSKKKDNTVYYEFEHFYNNNKSSILFRIKNPLVYSEFFEEVNWTPERGDQLWYLTGQIQPIDFFYDPLIRIHREAVDVKNYFRTREIAEIACEKIKELLNTVDHE